VFVILWAYCLSTSTQYTDQPTERFSAEIMNAHLRAAHQPGRSSIHSRYSISTIPLALGRVPISKLISQAPTLNWERHWRVPMVQAGLDTQPPEKQKTRLD